MEEKKNKQLYSATNIPFTKHLLLYFAWEKKPYDELNITTKQDTFWYDPVEFMRKISIQIKINAINKEIKTNIHKII